ncbi:MAG TPA: cysteine desulfurase family protein [Kiloniellales bacterium]
MVRRAYLDYNATAPIRASAAAAVSEALRLGGNPSSVHAFGRAARARLEDARESVAALVGARPEQLVFTSGGTEANNLALAWARGGRVLVSAGEHSSVLEAAPEAERIPLKGDGQVDLAVLERRLAETPRPSLVSLMLANNETGVVQPLAEAVGLARAAGVPVHCDAVQAAGKMVLDVGALGVQLLSLSAHKIGGPAGVGALVIAGDLTLEPLLRGGGQERRRRAGTENLAGIAGFAAAAREAAGELSEFAKLAQLRNRIEAEITAVAPAARIFGVESPRLANTTCVAMPGVRAETQVMALDLAGVAVSAGAACSSGKVAPSHVLKAMGVGDALADGAIRVSLGWASVPEDVEQFLAAWAKLYDKTRRSDTARPPRQDAGNPLAIAGSARYLTGDS